jgi:predicted ATPase/class 3 adenylate cyclase
MAGLPDGTVTFLLTDVEGSTRLWDEHPDAARQALARHDALIDLLAAQHRGCLVRPRGEGDSRFVVFARATDAVAAAAAIQRAMHDEPWPTPTPVKLRVALHTGEADLRDGDYYGSAVNRCARLRAIAHGGQTLLSQATADLVREGLPDGEVLRDLGLRRLRDLTAPERVFQLAHPGRPDAFPPLRSLDATPNNLPPPVTSFVGREPELAEVTALLASARLVTLTGTGGAGKTRLALQVAAELVDRFPDGVWFAELAPVADPAVVPPTVLAAVGGQETPGRPPLDALVEHLGAATALLLLDNCEHLLDAAARVADAVVRRCPGVRVLTTSRELLGLAGERAWRVPSLAAPDLDRPEPLDAIAAYPAVRLFAERARAVRPDFAIADDNAAAVARVCARLDGIPLAVELAAARIAVLTPEQIAARLGDRFRLLTGGSRTALRRQQTLRALVDWSYDLLAESEKALLRRLAVFAGGFALEAAEAVGAGAEIAAEDVLDLLTALVQKSLVVVDQREREARYGLLETIRQYAEEKLADAGESASVRDRHRAWCLALAERGSAELMRRDQAAWYRRLEQEHANLRAALDWCRDDPAGAEAEMRLAAALGLFWRIRGHGDEGRRWLARALARSDGKPTATRARLLNWLGYNESAFGDPKRALDLLTESVEVARAVGDAALLPEALRHLATIVVSRGDHDAGRALLEEALDAARAVGDAREEAFALGRLGFVALLADDVEASVPLFEQSLALGRQVGEAVMLVNSLSGCGIGLMALGDHEAAAPLFAECVARAESIGQSAFVAIGTVGLAMVDAARGDHDAAREKVRRAVEMQRPVGGANLVDVLTAASWVEARAGRPYRAARLLGALDAWLEPRRGRRRSGAGAPGYPVLGRAEAAARAATEPARFEAAWQEGRAMSVDEAAAFVLGDGR